MAKQYMIIKASRVSTTPYSGVTCKSAGILVGKIYDTKKEARADASKMTAINIVGFKVVPVPPKPTDLVHCTLCGRMHSDADSPCPSCGNEDSQRALKFVGVPIYMTNV